jgi:hypothetical protein
LFASLDIFSPHKLGLRHMQHLGYANNYAAAHQECGKAQPIREGLQGRNCQVCHQCAQNRSDNAALEPAEYGS